MTVRRTAADQTQFFTGLSSDTKPTASSPWKPSARDEFYETDKNQLYVYSGDAWVQWQVAMKRQAGERAEDSTTGADHQATAQESAISAAIDLSVDTNTTVYNAPAILLGIWVEVTIGTAAPVIEDNAVVRMTLPLALPIGFHALPGIIFETSLVVNPTATGTGKIRLCYRPLPATVTWAY